MKHGSTTCDSVSPEVRGGQKGLPEATGISWENAWLLERLLVQRRMFRCAKVGTGHLSGAVDLKIWVAWWKPMIVGSPPMTTAMFALDKHRLPLEDHILGVE